MRIYQGDLAPDLEIVLTSDNQPVALDAASEVRVIGFRPTGQVFSRVATGSAQGRVVMPFQSGDTATLGRISLEVVVTWDGSRPQTFPVTGVVDVKPRRST